MSYYIIIRGPLGIGKTSISKELAKRIKAEHISIDGILDEFKLTEDKEEGYISKKSFLKSNEIAGERVKSIIDRKPVIFDGNFYWKEQIEDLIGRLNYKYYVITLDASVNTCINRDRKRRNSIGEDAVKAVYEKVTSFEYGVKVEAENKSVNECVNEIIINIK